jgi:hypothetical protein
VTPAADTVDLAEVGARIKTLTERLAAIDDARELAGPLEDVSNAGYGAALVLEAESRRARRGIAARPDSVDLELVRTLDALELAASELRRSLTSLRERAVRLGAPCTRGLQSSPRRTA